MDLHEKSLPGSYPESAGETAVSAGARRASWLHRNRLAANLAFCFVALTASTMLVGFFAKNNDGTNVIWIANGLMLAYLLLAPRWHWPYYLMTGVAALTVGSALIGEHWRNILMFNSLNFIEVLIGAVLLRPRSLVLPRFTNWSYLLRFVLFAVIAGPLVAGLIFTVISMGLWRQDPTTTLMGWLTADCLGIAVATPMFVAIFQSDIKFGLVWRRNWSYLILLMGVTCIVFARGPASYLFLIYPLLLWVLFRMGIGWAATGTLFVAVVGGWYSVHGSGPLGAGSSLTQVDRALMLQIFVAVAIAMLYGVSVVMESQATSERRLKEIASLFSLVTDNSRDAILLTDFDDHRLYMSAAMKRLLQWSEEEFAKQRTIELVHPDDRRKALRVMHELNSGGEGASLECRVLKRDGLYLWVEASLRAVRNPAKGVPRGVLNIVRDISERKVSEKRLQQAYSALEAAADKDPLTGLANRRRFDQSLASEWRRGVREQRPLSLLMIDADLFKSYNDTYGHPRGDFCLRQIADAALEVVVRPGDLVARLGGEEFAVLLPNTEENGALMVAHDICAAVRRRNLEHSGNATGIITVSAGCGTIVPSFGQHPQELIELADEALYLAKRSGRNRVCVGEAAEGKASTPVDAEDKL